MTDAPVSGDEKRAGRASGADQQPESVSTDSAEPAAVALDRTGAAPDASDRERSSTDRPTVDETAPDDSAEGAEEYDAVPASEHVAHGEPGADLVDEPAEPDVPKQDEPRQDEPTRDAPPPALVEPPEREAAPDAAATSIEAEREPEPEPAVREPEPAAVAAPAAATPTSSFFVEPPVAPKARHNRGFGVGIALLSSLLFAALYAVVVVGISVLYVTAADFAEGMRRFLASPAYWVPVIAYAVFAVLTALILNRARWAAHVFFSLLIGILVYGSSVGVILLIEGVLARSGREQLVLLATALAQPVLLAAALCAREVALWTGLATAARGRRVVARNKADREAYEQEKARSEAVWNESGRAS